MKCVKVLKKDAQKTKQKLIALDAWAKGYLLVSGREYLYFPVSKEVKGYEIVEKECEKVMKVKLELLNYDKIGDIVIAGEDVSDIEAKKLINVANVKVVLRKVGIHHGEFRTQDLEYIAGEKRKETVYRENGVQMKLDVEKCYFSPRLGTERMRIGSLVKDKEKVLVLFSGVAPYPLVIAKHAKPSLIVGVEKNPIAHKYAEYNCRNYSNIKLFNEDAMKFNHPEKFDRILMPLPKSAEAFLPTALRLLNKNGVIHFYDFLEEKNIPEKAIQKVKKNIKNAKVLKVVKCGQYAPGRFRICVDFKIDQ